MFRGINNFRDYRNTGKSNKGDRRNFKDRDRSYDKGISRDIDNTTRFNTNRRDSRFRNRTISISRDKSEEWCHYCAEMGHFIKECQKKKWDQGKPGEQKHKCNN